MIKSIDDNGDLEVDVGKRPQGFPYMLLIVLAVGRSFWVEKENFGKIKVIQVVCII